MYTYDVRVRMCVYVRERAMHPSNRLPADSDAAAAAALFDLTISLSARCSELGYLRADNGPARSVAFSVRLEFTMSPRRAQVDYLV